jgi:hypothetical protein
MFRRTMEVRASETYLRGGGTRFLFANKMVGKLANRFRPPEAPLEAPHPIAQPIPAAD